MTGNAKKINYGAVIIIGHEAALKFNKAECQVQMLTM